jgi:hypothetical protein
MIAVIIRKYLQLKEASLCIPLFCHSYFYTNCSVMSLFQHLYALFKNRYFIYRCAKLINNNHLKLAIPEKDYYQFLHIFFLSYIENKNRYLLRI